MALKSIVGIPNFSYVYPPLTGGSTGSHYDALASGTIIATLPDYFLDTNFYKTLDILAESDNSILLNPKLPDYNLDVNFYKTLDDYAESSDSYILLSGSSSSSGSGERPVKYKMRGWRSATSAYEYWITENPNDPPPTGNVLIDITIAQIMRY